MEESDLNDITLFNDYIKSYSLDFNKNMHIPYFIGSPTHLYKDSELSKKNDALVPVIILIKKEDGAYNFEEITFSWKSIDLLQTYSRVSANGQLQYLGDTEDYEQLFDERILEVEVNEVQELTLNKVVKKHKYYPKLSPRLLEKYKDEKFLIFSFEEKNYILPVIEVVRFFYCLSEKDSLKQAIFHPSGLSLLVKEVVKMKGTNRQNLYLETASTTVDNKKIFYFQHKKNFLSMFNSVFYNYKKNGLIKATFPSEKKFNIACKILKLPTSLDETYLITRIVATNIFNDFLKISNIDLHVYHPQSKREEDKTGKRDPKKDRKRKVPKKKPKNFNDKLSTSAEIPAQTIEDAPNKDYFPDSDWKVKIERSGKREEKGGHIVNIPVDVTNTSTRDGKGNKKGTAQKIITSNTKSEIEDYPEPDKVSVTKNINDSSRIIQEFRLQGFYVESEFVYDFPDKSEYKKRAISYADKDMLNKRQYVILHLSKDSKKYIYLDVEAKNNKKEVLVLVSQLESIAHDSVYQQVYYGNHKWLSKESLDLEEDVDFIRIRHSTSEKQLVKNIIEKLH